MTKLLTGAASPDHAFWIARSVARVLGLDLSGALADGRLTPQGYAMLVARCENCRLAEGCQLWLAQQTGTPAAPIEGCANAEDFAALAR